MAPSTFNHKFVEGAISTLERHFKGESDLLDEEILAIVADIRAQYKLAIAEAQRKGKRIVTVGKYQR